MIRTATFDDDRVYRYRLTRIWEESLPSVTWVILNPSTADERDDDPTITRVVSFSRRWGFGSAQVVNLFAFRAPSPGELARADDPVGAANDATILETLDTSETAIAAWGNHGSMPNPGTGIPRCDEIWRLLDHHGGDVRCLRLTAQGQPAHPLYVPGDTRPDAVAHPVRSRSSRLDRPGLPLTGPSRAR